LQTRKTELSTVSKRNPALGAILALTGALLFGLNASTSKVIIQAGVDPAVLVLYRSFATAAIAGLVLAVTKPANFKLNRAEVPKLLIFGVIGVALMQWSYSQAVANLQVGIALLIEYTAIIWVPLASLLLFKDRLRKRIWVAIALVLGGLAIVANPGSQNINAVGVVYAFMAAVFLTVYFIMGEQAQKTRDTMSTLFYTMLISAIFWIAFSPWMSFDLANLSETTSLNGNLANVSVPLWLLFLFIGIFGSFVPMALSYRALHHLSATGVGVASTAETVFAFGFGLLWLGEAVSGTQLAGALLVIIGIVLAQTARIKH
jgi:drug/metabolite transporter (DMT)-like permease